jgi:hypothetical protein
MAKLRILALYRQQDGGKWSQLDTWLAEGSRGLQGHMPECYMPDLYDARLVQCPTCTMPDLYDARDGRCPKGAMPERCNARQVQCPKGTMPDRCNARKVRRPRGADEQGEGEPNTVTDNDTETDREGRHPLRDTE